MKDLEAEALRERVIARELHWDRVEAAAYAGHAVAGRACALAYPARLVPLPPSSARGLLGRIADSLRRRPRPSPLLRDLGDWARGLERWGHAISIKAAVGIGRELLPVWDRARPGLATAADALGVADLAATASGGAAIDDARKAALLLDSLRPDGPAPLPDVVDLLADIAWGARIDLAALIVRAAHVIATVRADHAAEAAGAAARAAGASDFGVWDARRKAALDAASRSVEEGAATVRRAASEAVSSWLLGGPGVHAPLPREPLDVVEARRRGGPPRPSRPPPASAPAPATGLDLSPKSVAALGMFIPHAGHFIAAAVEAEAQLVRPGRSSGPFRPEDPGARWDCPRCRRLVSNGTLCCPGCDFRLA